MIPPCKVDKIMITIKLTILRVIAVSSSLCNPPLSLCFQHTESFFLYTMALLFQLASLHYNVGCTAMELRRVKVFFCCCSK